MIDSADDKLVWAINSGSVLTCSENLVMEGTDEVAFSEGCVYRVESMHPIANPAYVKTTDDQGRSHCLEATDLRKYFGR